MIQIIEFSSQLPDARVGPVFEKEVLNVYPGKLLILWFWLPYCPACIIMEMLPQKMPTVIEYSGQEEAIICKINVDDVLLGNQLIYSFFLDKGLPNGLPSFLLMKDRAPLGVIEGAVDGLEIIQAIKKFQ